MELCLWRWAALVKCTYRLRTFDHVHTSFVRIFISNNRRNKRCKPRVTADRYRQIKSTCKLRKINESNPKYLSAEQPVSPFCPAVGMLHYIPFTEHFQIVVLPTDRAIKESSSFPTKKMIDDKVKRNLKSPEFPRLTSSHETDLHLGVKKSSHSQRNIWYVRCTCNEL